jgi:putative ABC transport system permease protein
MRRKGYSLINILGLAVGMATVALIMLWVTNELSYDSFHENTDRIYRVTNRLQIGNLDRSAPNTMAPAGPAMVQEIPGISAAARFAVAPSLRVKHDDKQFYEDNAYYADTSVFDVFSFHLKAGDESTALTRPYSVVLTGNVAARYFGDDYPIGKTLLIDGKDEYTITGILEEVPQNSHLTFDILMSFETLYAQDAPLMQMWNRLAYFTYVLLAKDADPVAVEARFPALIQKYLGKLLESRGASQELFLQPITDIHLYSELEGDPFSGGSITYIYIFSGIALLVLVMASLNFINLVTARSTTRTREVAIRKTFGARRPQLILQFLGESVVLFLIAMILALVLLGLALPTFNAITGYDFRISDLPTPSRIVIGFLFTILVAAVAGAYPAFYLSSFNPTQVIRAHGSFAGGTASRSMLRRILLASQFTISIALIACALIVHNQIDFLTSRDLGFDQHNVIVMTDVIGDGRPSLSVIKEKLSTVGGLQGVSASSTVPGWQGMLSSVVPEGFAEQESQMVSVVTADADYIPVMGMTIVEGRNFDDNRLSDKEEAVIINQTAAVQFGWENPINRTIRMVRRHPEGQEFFRKTVVGIVKDFHTESLHSRIGPVLIERSDTGLVTLALRVTPAKKAPALKALRSIWSELAPDYPFNYFLLAEFLKDRYGSEQSRAQMITCFAVLAVFVAMLGLLGMSAFSTESRSREIAIRKVLGASVMAILRLLCWEFTVLLAIGSLLAWAIVYVIMNQWLGRFPYHISIDGTAFPIATMVVAGVGLIIMSLIVIQAALANPADKLRYE